MTKLKFLLLIALLSISCKDNKQPLKENYFENGSVENYSVSIGKNSNRLYIYTEENVPGLHILGYINHEKSIDEKVKMDTLPVKDFQKMIQSHIENYYVAAQKEPCEWTITFSANYGLDELSTTYNSSDNFNDVSPEFKNFMDNLKLTNTGIKQLIEHED